MEEVGNKSPGLLKDGDRIWNMDETSVDAEFGARVKIFSDSASHHGGSRTVFASGGNGRHVTAVIAVSGSGKKCPPFFIVEGKNVMENWINPLPSSLFDKYDSQLVKRLTTTGWFPREGVICTSESGSMNMDIFRVFIIHLNTYARKHFVPEERFLLTIDGHASRKGVDWLEECQNISCDAVLAPANTSHFLQPCDQDINKRFKKELRNVRDELCCITPFDHKSIQFKLMIAVVAHDRITTEECVTSFCKTGLFPFNRSFAEKFKRPIVDLTENSPQTTANQEKKTAELARGIVQHEVDDSRMIQRLTTLLKNVETANSIVMSHAPRGSMSSASSQRKRSSSKKRDRKEKKRSDRKEERKKQKAVERAAEAERKRVERELKQQEKARRDLEKAQVAAQRKAARDEKKAVVAARKKHAEEQKGELQKNMGGEPERGGLLDVEDIDEGSCEKRMRSPTKHARSPMKKFMKRNVP